MSLKPCKFFIGNSKTPLDYNQMLEYIYNNPNIITDPKQAKNIQDKIAEEEKIEDFVVEEDEDFLNNLFEQINGKPKPPQPLGIVSPAFAQMMQPSLPKVKSFVPKPVQERIDDARKAPKEKWYKRAGEVLDKVHNSFTRMYAALDPKKFADVIDKLRILKAASEDAKLLAETYLVNLLKPLNPNQRAYLQDFVLLDDLVGSIEDGLYGDVNNQNPLPFGFKDFQEVIDARDAIQVEVDADPKLKAAIVKRNDFVNNLYEAAKRAGLTNADQVGNGRSYFHRQIIKYNSESDMREAVMKTAAARKKLSQFKKRKGSELDYLTNFAEVEYTVVAGTAFEIAKRQAINNIIKPFEAEWKQIVAEAKVNAQQKVDDIAATFGTNSPEHLDAIKNQKDYEISERLELMNPDYVLYKPEGKNILFRSDVVSGSVIDTALDELANNNVLGATNILVDNVKYILQAGQGRTMYIPKELAETFDKIGSTQVESDVFFNALKNIAQGMTNTFKKLVLLSPTRLIKYYAGNLAGDFDKLTASNPLVLTKLPSASKEIYDARANQNVSQEYKEAVKYGVIGSGTQVEFGKVDEKAWARFSTLRNPTIADYFSLFAKNGLGVKWAYDKWFDLSRGIANSREDAFRFAAYKFALQEIQKGKKFYWFSSKAEIDQITDPKRKAAKLAREIFGDYGAISESGESIAKLLYPFYRFRETNIRGYKNFIFNNIDSKAGRERILKYGLKRGVTVATTKALVNYSRMAMFTAAIALLNKLKFPDEEEELQKAGMDGFHIILGRDENGNVRYYRTQGTMNAFMESMGLNGIANEFSDYSNGTATLGEVAAKPGESFVNEFYQGMNPLIKSPIELSQGKSFFPSITNPRSIKDSPYNLEYLSNQIGQRYLYDALMDKPRKDKDFLNMFVTNSVNPKESAYYTTLNLIKTIKGGGQFVSETGKIDGNQLKEEKRNALFEWKQHLKFGNVEKSNEALKRFYDLGGTEKDLKKQIANLDPLHGLNKFERAVVDEMLIRKVNVNEIEKEFNEKNFDKKTNTYDVRFNGKFYKDVDQSSAEVIKMITKKELDYIKMAQEYYNNTFETQE